MNRPSRVRVKGPLEPYVDGFRQQLAGQGYSPWTATAHLQLMAQVSCWLAAHRLGVGALTAAGVESFLQDRRASGQARRLSPRGLVPLLGYLRGLGVAPEPAPPVPQARWVSCWMALPPTWSPSGAWPKLPSSPTAASQRGCWMGARRRMVWTLGS
jgi:hypothetical protein